MLLSCMLSDLSWVRGIKWVEKKTSLKLFPEFNSCCSRQSSNSDLASCRKNKMGDNALTTKSTLSAGHRADRQHANSLQEFVRGKSVTGLHCLNFCVFIWSNILSLSRLVFKLFCSHTPWLKSTNNCLYRYTCAHLSNYILSPLKF